MNRQLSSTRLAALALSASVAAAFFWSLLVAGSVCANASTPASDASVVPPAVVQPAVVQPAVAPQTSLPPQTAVAPRTALPHKVLWAWQRAEDLSYIDSQEYGVAYLACHVVLKDDRVFEHWRDQPLKVPPDACLSPVVRIDCDHRHAPELGHKQLERILVIADKVSKLPRTAQLQIDYDALESERPFYRQLLEALHSSLPNIPVSITALTSWCLFDDWIKDLPVSEKVPMLFSLGAERDKILLYFRSHRDFLVSGCCRALGLSLEDSAVNQLMIPAAKKRTIPVRFYIFTRTPWTKHKYHTVQSLLSNHEK